MNYLGEVSYVMGIEIICDRSQWLLGLSRKAYTKKILEKFNMDNFSPLIVSIQKEDKFNSMQYPKNDIEQK